MREIKFRAFDKQENKMIATGFHVFGEVHTFGLIECHCHETRGDKDSLMRLNDIEIMQFTGLKDKNGVEIYEGDIVKTSTDKVMQISWSNRFASFVIDRKGWMFSHWFGEAFDSTDCEVIGNIFQHQDLLK